MNNSPANGSSGNSSGTGQSNTTYSKGYGVTYERANWRNFEQYRLRTGYEWEATTTHAPASNSDQNRQASGSDSRGSSAPSSGSGQQGNRNH